MRPLPAILDWLGTPPLCAIAKMQLVGMLLILFLQHRCGLHVRHWSAMLLQPWPGLYCGTGCWSGANTGNGRRARSRLA